MKYTPVDAVIKASAVKEWLKTQPLPIQLKVKQWSAQLIVSCKDMGDVSSYELIGEILLLERRKRNANKREVS